MNSFFDLLDAAGARFNPGGRHDIPHFGDPEQELRLAATGTVLAPLPHLAGIRASGADARNFLHGQLTSDVKSLQEGQAQLAAWCTPKGRMLANFILYPEAEDVFGLILSAELLPDILKRLRIYVLRSQVELTDLSADTGCLGLSGPKAAAILEEAGFSVPQAPMEVTLRDDTRLIGLPEQRFILFAAQESLPDLWRQLSARISSVGHLAWRWLDIRATFPWITGVTTEAFVPQMMNFEKLGGISFQKGCYPGQEVVARAQYLGEIKRHLYRIQSPAALLPGETLCSLGAPGWTAGKVIVAAPDPEGQHVALAVVLDAFVDDLHQGAPDGPLVYVKK